MNNRVLFLDKEAVKQKSLAVLWAVGHTVIVPTQFLTFRTAPA